MVQVQQRVLIALAAALVVTPDAEARKFYDDDPMWRTPPPMNVAEAKNRKLNDIYDFFYMTFGKPGEKQIAGKPIPAGAVNTLGEVPDSEWYTNRHWKKRMTIEELVRGPGNENPPSTDRPWEITEAKSEGVSPGFRIKDSKGRTYQIKFDTHRNFEQATGADVMGSKFFYALGYNTPENHVVYFRPEQLRVGEGTMFTDYRGVERPMRQSDVQGVLAQLPTDDQGRYRAVASMYVQGKPIGPFRYFGTRADDPNDIVPHEHRRDLRGLRVFAAWTNHNDSKSLNSLDTFVQQNGRQYIRHYLIDFSAVFGAEAFAPKSPRAGFVPLFDWTSSAKSFFTFGLYVPSYARADHPYIEEIGRLEWEKFKPGEWVSNYYNPAFANELPDDGFWAAKQVMTFTEPEVRAIVNTAGYTSKEGTEYLIRSLMQRREKIGRYYFSLVLPLDDFRVEGARLRFEDLAAKYGFTQPRTFRYTWLAFDNNTEARSPIAGAASSDAIPASFTNGYAVVQIAADDAKKTVDVFLRRRGSAVEVVGVERHW